MADNQNTGVELFSGIQSESKLNFSVNVDTLIDAVKIPLEMNYESKIKKFAVALKAKEKEAAAASDAYLAARRRTDDAMINDRKVEFQALIAKTYKAVVAIAGEVEVDDPNVEANDFCFNDAAGTRTFVVRARIPHSTSLKDGVACDGFGIRGIGVVVTAAVVAPFTDEQKALKESLDALASELAALKETWSALVKEKEEAVRAAERLARTKYASVALSEVSGGSDLVNKVYDSTFFANLAPNLAALGIDDLVASGLLPGSGGEALKGLGASPKAAKKS